MRIKKSSSLYNSKTITNNNNISSLHNIVLSFRHMYTNVTFNGNNYYTSNVAFLPLLL